MITYIFLLPDIKFNSGLGNSDRFWQATSFSTWLLRKQESNGVNVWGYFDLMVHQMFSVVDSRTTVITDESLGLLSDLSARMRFFSHHSDFCVSRFLNEMVQHPQVTDWPQRWRQAWPSPLQQYQQQGKQSCRHRYKRKKVNIESKWKWSDLH